MVDWACLKGQGCHATRLDVNSSTHRRIRAPHASERRRSETRSVQRASAARVRQRTPSRSGATASYPASLADVPELQPYLAEPRSAARVETLPHPADKGWVLVSFHDQTAIKRTERMRADFVANASHELKTPIAGLAGFIETLRGPARDDANARERFLGIMAEQADRMRRLVDDLLMLSRIEQHEHSRPAAAVDVGRVLRGVNDLLHLKASSRGVALEIDVEKGLPPAVGDYDELTIVFQNLIDNAIKYTRGASTVRVVARATGGGSYAPVPEITRLSLLDRSPP